MWLRFGLQLDRVSSSAVREQVSKAEYCRFDPGLLLNLFSVKVVGALVLLFFLQNQTRKLAQFSVSRWR